jgi:hypothetical protein
MARLDARAAGEPLVTALDDRAVVTIRRYAAHTLGVLADAGVVKPVIIAFVRQPQPMRHQVVLELRCVTRWFWN